MFGQLVMMRNGVIELLWPKPLISARFIHRENRFLAKVELRKEEKEAWAHVPSPGRMRELLLENANVFLRVAANPERKTQYDLFAVKTPDNVLVIIDSHVANEIVKEAFQNQLFFPISELSPEQKFGESRLDFFVKRQDGKGVWVEVKSVTLNEQGTALFPDAPTLRGSRHLEELVLATRQEYDAIAIFAIMRNDCTQFSPNEKTDPLFATTLKEATRQGVTAKAFSLKISEKSFALGDEVPVVL